MLKVSKDRLAALEARYPGIGDTIAGLENGDLPSCPSCHSSDTASVQVGIVGRSIELAAATTKVKLVANNPPERMFCNACNTYFRA
jgi:hypothetical protein